MLRAEGSWVRITVTESAVSLFQNVRSPPSLLLNVYRVTYPGVKSAGREFNHSSSPNAEVTNERSYTPHPNIPSWRGQGNLTFF